MGDMGKTELTPMVAVDPFHLPQSEPLALTVNNKKKEFRQEQEEKEDEVNFKRLEEKKSGFTFTVADDNGENQSFTLQVLQLDVLEDVPTKDPLADASNTQMREITRPPKKRLKVDCSNSDEVKSLKRKNYYKNEQLCLECEWANCAAVFEKFEGFASHISSHVKEAEVREQAEECVFGCLWAECGFECPASAEMVRHINFHSFHTKIKCHGLNMLTSHGLQPCLLDPSQRNIVPDLSDPFECEWVGCELANVGWELPHRFYAHVAGHGEEVRGGEVVCGWAGCNKADGSVSKLKEHLRCHSQERLVGCPTCGGLFANRVKFLDHCKRQHVANRKKMFECTNCGKKFALERLLRDHMRSHINHYKCPHCDMTCPTPSSRNNHIRYKHMDDKPFSCDLCDYKGKTPADLKGHIRVHYAEEELKCSESGCDFTCRAQATLKSHYLKKHAGEEIQYECHLCHKRYNRGNSLTKHLISVHNFSWPSGHSRFRYNRDEASGVHRLQTIRFESADLQEELQGGSSLRIADQEGELREDEEEEQDNPGAWTPSEDSPGPWASSPVPQSSAWEPGGSSSLRSTESIEDNPSFSSDQNYFDAK